MDALQVKHPQPPAGQEAFLATILQQDIFDPKVTIAVLVMRDRKVLLFACASVRETLALIRHWSPRADVYVGMAPRHRPVVGREGIDHGHVLFADLDTREQVHGLFDFPLAPTILNQTSPRKLQAVWKIAEPTPTDQLEAILKRLVRAIPSDPAAVDAARRFRVPGTWNWKPQYIEDNAGEPYPVEVVDCDLTRVYTLADFERVLPGPEAVVVPLQRPVDLRGDDELRSIPAAMYVPALTGRHVGRDSKVNCPFHDERTPSFHCHDTNWYCYGACRRGGSIIDFGSMLYDIEPRGRGYHEIVERLGRELGIAAA